MIFVSRKIVYPLFVLAFAVVFFVIVYLVSFSQVLSVSDASVEFSGEKILLSALVKNISNHRVSDAAMLVKLSGQEVRVDINSLEPGEEFLVVTEVPFSSDLTYDVYVTAPFNRTIYLPFKLDQTTVEPVKAKVQLTSEMLVGEKYQMVVELCNVSESSLPEVYWVTTIEGDFFESNIPVYNVALAKNDCKNLYPSLTPISPGNAKLTFILRIGSLEQKYSHEVKIVSG